MHMRTAIVMLAMPLLVSSCGHRYGGVHSIAGLRAGGDARSTTLGAGDATLRQAAPVPPRPPRKPKTTASKSPARPSAKATGGHTSIAPFPVPGDTSRSGAEKMQTLNLPKQGVTTIAPLPPPGVDVDRSLQGHVPPPQVDVFPEATARVPPSYPDAARHDGIQGTVRVGAHVLEDGSVDSVMVVRSVAGLDSVALDCVKQWRFRPASYRGKPVAVWVVIPVRFTLH